MLRFAFLAVFLLLSLLPVRATVLINEVMSSNGSTIADEDGDFSDWIELFNDGDEPVDLSGWGLSDSYNNPFKWTFPAGATIGAGKHLLVWASGKNRAGSPPEPQPPIVRLGSAVNCSVAHRRYANFVTTGESGFVADYNPANTTNRAGWQISPILPGETVRVSVLVNTGGRNVLLSLAPDGGMADYQAFAVTVNSAVDTLVQVELTNTTTSTTLNYVVFVVPSTPGAGSISVSELVVSRPVLPEPVWHTGYSLSASGEEVVLTMPDGTRVDELPPTALPRNVSIGRAPGGGDAWFYFDEPTPGGANETKAYVGILDPPNFSHPGGFYQEGFDLALSHENPGATIVYTVDGSEPDIHKLDGAAYQYKTHYQRFPDDPDGSLLDGSYSSSFYTAPLTIEDVSLLPDKLSQRLTSWTQSQPLPANPVRKGVVVRAKAYLGDYLPTAATHTYFVWYEFNCSLPVISLATTETNLFDYHDGIYTPGIDFDVWRAANPAAVPGSRVGNFARRGRESERSANIELFRSGSIGAELNQDAGFRIHGNSSRNNWCKSLRLYARSGYESPPEFNTTIFSEGIAGAAVKEGDAVYDRLLLRRRGGQPGIRDVFMQRVLAPVLHCVMRSEPAVHFVNGEYWGLTFIRDNFDEYHISKQFNLSSDNIVITYSGGVVSRKTFPQMIEVGTDADLPLWQQLEDFIVSADLSLPSNYEFVAQQLDIDSYIDHLVAIIFLCSNHYEHGFWRVRELESAPFGDGKWRAYVKDLDVTHAAYVAGTPGEEGRRYLQAMSTNVPLLKSLLENFEFRNHFINRFADHLNTIFLPDRVGAIVQEVLQAISPHLQEDFERWNYALSPHNAAYFANISATRIPEQRGHIMETFGLAGQALLTVADQANEQGSVRVNSIDLRGLGLNGASWTGTYFRDVPVELEALPESGYRFVGWLVAPTGGIVPMSESDPVFYSADALIPLNLMEDTTVEAVFEPIPAAELPVAMHEWNFQNAGNLLAPSFTTGGASLVITPGPSTQVLANTGSDFPTQHLRVNNPSGAVMTFALPTTGYEAIRFDYVTRRSGQGVEQHVVSYTLDGSAWATFSEYLVADAPPQARNFDFSGVEGAENNPLFAVRVSMSRSDAQIDAGTGLEGNNRFDDVVLSGVALPGVKPPPVVNVDAVPANLPLRGGWTTLLDLSEWFTDPDGAPLEFAAQSLNPDVLQVNSTPDGIVLTPVKTGEAVLQVTANDGVNAPVGTEVRVLVYPQAFALADGGFSFANWSAAEPAGSYPANMIFLQSEVNDPMLTTELGRAYQIPLDDAAVLADAEFPYAATSRTRINGLGDDGIAFINTGRGRDVGAALVALDTTDVEEAFVTFTAGTVVPNVRIYAIRLQYRIGSEGAFVGVTDGEGQPVEYVRNATGGHAMEIGPVALPEEAMGHPYVQLLWRYYFVSGGSGARPQLRLDDIVITKATEAPFGFAAWQAGDFSEAELADPDISGAAADPDGTGVSNLMRYALGLGRSSPPWESLPVLVHGAGTFRFPFDPDKTDIIYRVATSIDLSDWSDIVFDSSDSHGFELEGGILTLPVDTGGLQRFFRLEVVR